MTGTVTIFEMYEELGDLGYCPCSATVSVLNRDVSDTVLGTSGTVTH